MQWNELWTRWTASGPVREILEVLPEPLAEPPGIWVLLGGAVLLLGWLLWRLLFGVEDRRARKLVKRGRREVKRDLKECLRQGDLKEAGEIYEALGKPRKALRAYAEGGHHEERVSLLLRLDRRAQAMAAAREGGVWHLVAELAQEDGDDVGGIGIYLLGRSRGVPNAILWGTFPILHGFHEYAEYLLDELDAPFIVERFELLFAIGSSVVLLMAITEYLGSIPRPYGKLTGLITFIPITYFLLVMEEEAIELLEHQTFQFGILSTGFFRFFYGTVLVLVSIIILIYSYFRLPDEAQNQRLMTITGISSGLLVIFALFEGFTSDNPLFITLRGVSAVLFLLVPGYILFTNDLGLQILLITSESGSYLTGFDFEKQKMVDDDEAILTGNFIAAISSFSKSEEEIGGVSDITTTQGRYIINQKEDYIISLLTRNTNQELENGLIKFAEQLDDLISQEGSEIIIPHKNFKDSIQMHFGQYY